MPGSPESHSGQPRQKDGWDRWSKISDSDSTSRDGEETGTQGASRAGSSRLDTQTRKKRTSRFRHSYPTRPGPPDLGETRMEPEWEARFEADSYGFRPGRSAWDAMAAIYNGIIFKRKWVLDTDIEKCYDRIDHIALLKKIDPSPLIRRQLRAWLKAGVLDQGRLYPTEEGVLQGGTISCLLANIALHGMEEAVGKLVENRRKRPILIRYADDRAPRRRGKEAEMAT